MLNMPKMLPQHLKLLDWRARIPPLMGVLLAPSEDTLHGTTHQRINKLGVINVLPLTVLAWSHS